MLVLRLTFWILLSGSSPRADMVVSQWVSLWEWSSWMLSSTHGRGRKVVAMSFKYYHREPPEISPVWPSVSRLAGSVMWGTGEGGSKCNFARTNTRLANAGNEGCLIPSLDSF